MCSVCPDVAAGQAEVRVQVASDDKPNASGDSPEGMREVAGFVGTEEVEEQGVKAVRHVAYQR